MDDSKNFTSIFLSLEFIIKIPLFQGQNSSWICIEREIHKLNIEIDQQIYSINYKISYYFDGNEKKIVNIKPEYDNLKDLSRKTGYSIKKLLFLIQTKLQDKLDEIL